MSALNDMKYNWRTSTYSHKHISKLLCEHISALVTVLFASAKIYVRKIRADFIVIVTSTNKNGYYQDTL